MDLEKLRIFYVVAKVGSFSKASKILHISQEERTNFFIKKIVEFSPCVFF